MRKGCGTMNCCRKRMPVYTNMAVLLCALFLVYFVSDPFLSNRSSGFSTTLGKLKDYTNQGCYISEFSGNEFYCGTELTLTTNRNMQGFQNILHRFFYILFPFAGFCLLVCCYGHFNRKKSQQKHILATSFGGHAPPQRNQ